MTEQNKIIRLENSYENQRLINIAVFWIIIAVYSLVVWAISSQIESINVGGQKYDKWYLHLAFSFLFSPIFLVFVIFDEDNWPVLYLTEYGKHHCFLKVVILYLVMIVCTLVQFLLYGSKAGVLFSATLWAQLCFALIGLKILLWGARKTDRKILAIMTRIVAREKIRVQESREKEAEELKKKGQDEVQIINKEEKIATHQMA